MTITKIFIKWKMNNLIFLPSTRFVPLRSRVMGGLDHAWMDGLMDGRMSLIYHSICPDFKEEFTGEVNKLDPLFQVSACCLRFSHGSSHGSWRFFRQRFHSFISKLTTAPLTSNMTTSASTRPQCVCVCWRCVREMSSQLNTYKTRNEQTSSVAQHEY